ncbi:MAG: dUTP diphosphatase [Flavobacteriaceae bacterium]|nr:dUTP diphosphatase [Flavobacteriaceae bacterium]|tara:strand:+ start:1203 stop:1640 length:438 start_codon:yes stop_codon:yes gene_type:complete
MVLVSVQNQSNFDLPSYATKASSGVDLKAVVDTPVTLEPLERRIIHTGLKIALPEGYEAQIRPRSGLAVKYGITVLNSPGTIDADYRGEIGVILINLSNTSFTIQSGDRIAQLVIAKFEQIDWLPMDELSDTKRGEGGFGSTGKK